jgi:hypothetical protein
MFNEITSELTFSDTSKFSNVTVLFIPILSLLCDKDRYNE